MKTFSELREEINEACWKGYKQVGGKMKNGKMVPNCVPVKEAANAAQQAAIAIAMKKAGKKPKNEEVSPMIKPPNRRFDNKSDAFAHVKKHGGKVYKGTYIDPNNGTKHISFHVKEEVINERGEDSKGYKRSTEKGAGLTRAGVMKYRRQNPGSKLSTAVTTPPSKLKKGSKAWNRRKSFCARMSGVKGPMKDSKGRPTRKAMSLRRWHCEE